mmetsp:Transcript_17667/g.41549  ORF Transcript_17667/g.41549 Transcript_17667/m.41549 type:complete len:645 (+) Transcript_17667:195-2129(+)
MGNKGKSTNDSNSTNSSTNRSEHRNRSDAPPRPSTWRTANLIKEGNVRDPRKDHKKQINDRTEELDYSCSSLAMEERAMIEPTVERQVSRPGAFHQAGPAPRSDSDDEDSEVSSVNNHHRDDSSSSSNRERFQDEEDPVMIRATLVEEEERNDDHRLPSTAASRNARNRPPPLAHAEPWNEFIASEAATREQSRINKLKDGDGATGDSASALRDRHRKRACISVLVLCMLLLLGAGIYVMLWLQPQSQSPQELDGGASSSTDSDNEEDSDDGENLATPTAAAPSAPVNNETDHMDTSTAPSMAPTIQEPLLRRKDRYSHYFVQWGMQTEGCQSTTFPPLQLSCKSTSSVVHVIEHSTTSDSVMFDDENNGMDIDCERLGTNLMECRMEGAYQGQVFGALLVVCAVEEDRDESAPPRSLDLQATIPIGEYAQECNALLPTAESQTESITQVQSGGSMTPWLTMGRVCPSTSIDNNMFGSLLKDALRDHKKGGNNGGGNNRRLGGGGGGNGGGGSSQGGSGGGSGDSRNGGPQNFDPSSLFTLENQLLCEQGGTWSVPNTEKPICFDQSSCQSRQACIGSNPSSCEPSSCSVASGTVVASDMVGMMIDLAESDNKCWFENLLPKKWLRSLARGTPAPTSTIASPTV